MSITETGQGNTRALVNKLDAVGWGLFLIWVGTAFLANVGWAVGLLGVGVIAIGAQLARKYFGIRIEWFGLMMGIAFVVCGAWELLKIHASIPGGLAPTLCVVAGIIILLSALLRKPVH